MVEYSVKGLACVSHVFEFEGLLSVCSRLLVLHHAGPGVCVCVCVCAGNTLVLVARPRRTLYEFLGSCSEFLQVFNIHYNFSMHV